MLALTRLLAEDLRVARTVQVAASQLDNGDIARRLPNTRPVAVPALIDLLADSGFVLRVDSDVWRLTLPAPYRGAR